MNQKNLVAILGVAVVILLGTTIYFATINNISQPAPAPVAKQPATPAPVAQTPTQPVATQPAPTTPDVTQNYVEVKEFGIKIPVDSAMVGDLTYTYRKADVGMSSGMVSFSSKSLTAVDKNCGSGGGGPSIQKMRGVPPASGTDADYYQSRIANGDIKQFNGYFLMFANAQDTCTLGKNVELEKKLDQAVFVGYKNAVAIN